jgi:WD40 repeat protein
MVGNAIELEYPDIHFYATKDQFIYFAYENKNTSFSNIGFIDAATNVRVTVDNAHKLKVTGLIHIMDNNNLPLVLSSSIDGTIKVWRIEADKLVLNKEITDGINACFKTPK